MKVSKNKKIVLGISALVILIIALGYFVYINKLQNNIPFNSTIPIPNAIVDNSIPVAAPINVINLSDKIVSGTIVSSNQDNITIKLDDGTEQTLKPSKDLIILPIQTPGKSVSAIYDPSKIKAGTKVKLSLATQDNTEVVTTISYIK